MGLITKEVEIKLQGNNIKWYEEKGYEIKRRKDNKGRNAIPLQSTIKVNVNDLPDNSHAKILWECDECNKKSIKQWVNYKRDVKFNNKTYCKKCSHKLYAAENARVTRLNNGTSFEQWCKNNKRIDILERWDYELNKRKPSDISYASRTKCWFKCENGIHNSELKDIANFTSGHEGSMNCVGCNSIGQWLIDNYGDNAIELYWGLKNNKNPFCINYGSMQKAWIICQNCKTEKLIKINQFTRYGVGCPKCSDGVSYPNKIAFNMLDQLNIDFVSEFSPKWIKPLRYDFYFNINNNEYILEMDGSWHKKDNNISGITKEEAQKIDEYKDKLAKEHNIQLIRIDCDKSELEYIKANIINSNLKEIIKIDFVDWLNCEKFASSSFVKTTCDLWNSGVGSAQKIAETLKLSKSSVLRYLKIGTKFQWCDYNSQNEWERAIFNKSKKIYSIELERVFNSQKEIYRELGINNGHISDCCLGKVKSAGKLPDGTRLHWMFYEDWLKLHNNEIAS